jgi:acetyltransferase-like isoleucine patch superfamily enzyme
MVWSRIKGRLQYEIARLSRPHMIVGFRRHDGQYLRHTRISNTTFINYRNKLDIEDKVFIGHYNFIEASNGISIGEGCQITNYISITSHSSHISIRLHGPSYYGNSGLKGYVEGPVSIGKYTFIGPHTVIMPGTRIGKGCLISAFSQLKGEYPDFSIIKGNPAKVVGDTRELDKRYLDEYPELISFYESWAGNA